MMWGRSRIAEPETLHARGVAGVSKVRKTRLVVGNDELLVISTPCPSLASYRLSPNERAVAELMLRGLGNAEIAARRKVAVRTIANQAAAVFRKIGVSSRSELAATVMG